MKKTLLTAAVVSALVASTAASAAVVYDKDGTVLKVGARIEAQWYNAGNNNDFASKQKDSAIYNWTRFHFEGSSKLSSWATAFGKAEWDAADSDYDSKVGDGLKARDQFIGVNMGLGGKIQAGRYKSLMQNIVGITDNLGGDGMSGVAYVVGDSRNAGKLTYTWSGWGAMVALEYQSAKNDYQDHTFKYNLEAGYSVLLGYTSPEVLFGPIAIKAGWTYMDGQNDGDGINTAYDTDSDGVYDVGVDDQTGWAVSLAWGVPNKGLFIAAEYSELDTDFGYGTTYNITGTATDEIEQKSFEFALKYSWEFGLSAAIGYQWEYIYDQYDVYKMAQIPLVLEYNFNPNFKVYAQAIFGVLDSEDADGNTYRKTGGVDTKGDGNAFAVGARYTF